MAIQYRIEDAQRLQSELGDLGKHVQTAQRWALNAVTKKAATMISRDIRGVFNIKARDVKSHLSIRRFKRDSKNALIYAGASLPLSEFKPHTKRVSITATSKRGKKFRTHRRATTVRVRKDVGRQTVGRLNKKSGGIKSSKGFLAKGHVLSRRNELKSENNVRDKFSLISRYGPSIPGMVAHPSTIQRAQDLVRDELGQQFSDRLDYLLTRD